MKRTREQFIEKAKQIHGDKYDYSLVEYNGCKKKVKILCKKCGNIFEQTPDKHINAKEGCKYCSQCVLKNEFLNRANHIHNNKYEYDLKNYNGVNSILNIKCLNHGWFKQKARKHLEGQGCPHCGNAKDNNTFKEEVKKYYNNKIEIIDDYKDVFTKIKIKCNICGHISERKPVDILKGYSCYYCKSSLLERITENFLINNNIFFEREKTFDDLKDVGKLSYDFFIKDKKILIECNGIQHYIWQKNLQKTEHDFHKQLHHDWLKRKYANKNGYKLIIIPYWEISSFKKNNINKILEVVLK